MAQIAPSAALRVEQVADCGSPWKDICLKIVDPETKMEMPEGFGEMEW